jgi:hypothetical protein
LIVDLPADELAAVIATLKDVLGSDRYPHAPRLDALKAALARLEAAANVPLAAHSTSPPKAPPPTMGEKRGRR